MNAAENSILLSGLDGSNPLALLAALGTLRTLSLALPNERVQMSWEESAAAWRPLVTFEENRSHEEMIELLHNYLKMAVARASFDIGDNLNLQSSAFREHVIRAEAKARAGGDREDADFFAAFGCEACKNDDGVIEDTDLRTMSGGGHQHFLKFFRDLVVKTDAAHIRRALLQSWDYADDGRGLNLRWDPTDDRRYAMRWDDPSGDPIKTMRGANRLAIEALPLLPTMPTALGLATTCFEGSGARNTFFLWPIWNRAIPLDVIRSLLARSLYFRGASKDERAAACISGMFISQRITIGKFRNFTPARSA